MSSPRVTVADGQPSAPRGAVQGDRSQGFATKDCRTQIVAAASWWKPVAQRGRMRNGHGQAHSPVGGRRGARDPTTAGPDQSAHRRLRFERSSSTAQTAYRQGVRIKPIVYTAAIDRGYTPTTIIMDTPASFPGGAGSPVYSPMNFDKKFEGPITLRRALEDSRNVPAVRVMEQLGPAHVIQYARRLGLASPLPPYLAVALGAAEATLTEMTSAYSVFPNQGVRSDVFKRYKGRPRRERARGQPAEPKDAIRADTALS